MYSHLRSCDDDCLAIDAIEALAELQARFDKLAFWALQDAALRDRGARLNRQLREILTS